MKTWTFTGHDGRTTDVRAASEASARSLAMRALWGAPDMNILVDHVEWRGLGLSLVSTS